jgi:predicted MFS family arabinose efflux permease
MTARLAQSRWSVVVAYCILTAVTQILWVTFTPITTETAAYWHVSTGAVGWLSEVFPLVYVLVSLPFGRLTDRWFRGSLAVGAVLTAVGGLMRVLPGFSFVLLGQIVASLGQPMVLNAVNKVAVGYVSPKRRPSAIAASSASLFVGILLSTASAPFLLQRFGFPVLLWIQGVTSGVAALYLLVTLRRMPLYRFEQASVASIKSVWALSSVRRFSLLLFAGFGLFIAVTTWLQVLVEPVHISANLVGAALGLMTAAGIIGAAVIPPWAVHGSRGRAALCVSLIVSCAMLVTVLAGRPLWLFIVCIALAGFFLLADLPIVLTAAEAFVPAGSLATATGILLLFGNLGGIVLALCVQLLLGHRWFAVGLLALVAVASIPVAWRFRTVDEQQQPTNSSIR